MPMPALVPMLAKVNFDNPVFWAVLIGWVLTVVLHEFAHGLAAHLGGDHTIRERGGLTLNPFQYIHPVNSILLPVLFLVMGGVPLPGGVTYIRRDLLRGRGWQSAVSLAGPAMNFLLFALLLLPLHPRFGWVHPPANGTEWTPAQQFLATLATLQFLAGVFNLVPVPPLDGFGVLSPFLPRETVIAIRNSPMGNLGIVLVFALFWFVPGIVQHIYNCQDQLLTWAGLGNLNGGIATAFNSVMVG